MRSGGQFNVSLGYGYLFLYIYRMVVASTGRPLSSDCAGLSLSALVALPLWVVNFNIIHEVRFDI